MPTMTPEAGTARGDGRRFSRTFLAWLCALSGAYLALAVWVDPRGDFGIRVFPTVSLDSRKEKMYLFDRSNRTRPVQGLVLGSSRAMKVAPEDLGRLTGKRWFNFSVDSARAEDYLAIYRWARRRDPGLDSVLLGLDVEAFHDGVGFDDRLKACPELMRALEGGGAGSGGGAPLGDALTRLKTVMSRFYAQDVVRSLQIAVHRPPVLMSFDGAGYLHYVRWEGQRRDGSFDLQANLAGSREEYLRRFKEMRGLSEERKLRLRTLLGEARRDGVRVVLWLTPLHPDLAAYLARETRYPALLSAAREFAAASAKEAGAPFRDFSEPGGFGGTETGWYDGGHVDESNAALIVRALARDREKNGL